MTSQFLPGLPRSMRRAFSQTPTNPKGLSAQQFKKLLVVHKISRLVRFERQGVLMRPYADKVYRSALTKTHIAHHGVVNCFVDVAKRMGKEVVVLPEDMLDCECEESRRKLCDGVDLIVSMGGDHTFLKSQQLVWDQSVPILGINTHRDVYTGVLNTAYIDIGQKEEHTSNLLEQLDCQGQVSYEKRSRLLFESQSLCETGGKSRRAICLNETLVAEKDVSSASRYTLQRDGADLGLFKSSGLLVATGTGSTGWLYSVRQISAQQLISIKDLLASMEGANSFVKKNEALAQELSDQTVFPRDQDKMYFCVREGFQFTCGESEGFCTHMKVTSEMFNGQAIVDGWFTADLSLGDSFTLTADPKYALRVVNLDQLG